MHDAHVLAEAQVLTVEIRRIATGTGSSEVGSSRIKNRGRIARAPLWRPSASAR